MEIAAQFDARAKTYGAWFEKSLGTKYLDKLEKNALLDALKTLKRKRVKIAEIGPGRGRIARYLIEKMNIDAYYGVELSPKMAEDLKKQNLKRLKVIAADGSSYRLREKVNVAISIRQIKYNQDYGKQLQSMRNSLKKGGIIIIEFPSVFSIAGVRNMILKGEDVLFNPFKLNKELTKLGFTNLKTKSIRYLADNFYVWAVNETHLKLLVLVEKFLKILLPYWLGRSIIISAKAS